MRMCMHMHMHMPTRTYVSGQVKGMRMCMHMHMATCTYVGGQVKGSGEATKLGSLLRFFTSLDTVNSLDTGSEGAAEAAGGRVLTCEQFIAAVNEETPLGKMGDVVFASAMRGVTGDVEEAAKARPAATVDIS